MNCILTADLHLTDNPLEDYRWKIFETLDLNATIHKCQYIFILGDMFDRKDRHSGKLVNRLITNLLNLSNRFIVVILAGNHDAPITGEFYWEFLNQYENVFYLNKPVRLVEGIWLLPFSANPVNDWKDLHLDDAIAIFMHQPVEGVSIDGTRTLVKAPELPDMPDVPIFSGDIHHQQYFKGITYIGVPHPIHFDETWENRILVVKNSNFRDYEQIYVNGIRRSILDISSTDELERLDFKSGDQLRIRYNLSGKNLTAWPVEQERIRKWALDKKIFIASLEGVIQGDGIKSDTPEKVAELEFMDPKTVIDLFCKEQQLSDDIREAGLSLIQDSIS